MARRHTAPGTMRARGSKPPVIALTVPPPDRVEAFVDRLVPLIGRLILDGRLTPDGNRAVIGAEVEASPPLDTTSDGD